MLCAAHPVCVGRRELVPVGAVRARFHLSGTSRAPLAHVLTCVVSETCSAVASACGVDGVLCRELVSTDAVSLGRIVDSSVTPPHVDGVGYWLQVFRVDAQLVTALVVKLKSLGDGSDNLLVYEAVCLVSRTGPLLDEPIGTANWSCPIPASRNGINLV